MSQLHIASLHEIGRKGGVTAAVAPKQRLAVCVVHWRSPDSLVRTVTSLMESRGVDLDVVVVDNASGAEVVARLRRDLPLPVYVEALSENLGFAGGANYGFRILSSTSSPPSYVAVCAHDTLVEQDTLSLLVGALETSPRLGVVGPVLDRGDGVYRGGHGYSLEPWSWRVSELPNGQHPSDWLVGALMVFRFAALRAVGVFDERLFAYEEDVDICLRMWRAGWQVAYVDGARAREHGSAISGQGHVYMIARNYLLLARWHHGKGIFAREVARKLVHALRATMASLAPWRSGDQRRLSRFFAGAQFRAVCDAVRGRSGAPDMRIFR